MSVQRMNITLPFSLSLRLKKVKNKSAFIAQSLEETFRKEQEMEEANKLAEAYRLNAVEDKTVDKDWDVVSGDGL